MATISSKKPKKVRRKKPIKKAKKLNLVKYETEIERGPVSTERKSYGDELIVDLNTPSSEETPGTLKELAEFLCEELGFQPVLFNCWDAREEPEDNINGLSAILILRTSNITIHTLPKLNKVYVNIFTCGKLNVPQALRILSWWYNVQITPSDYMLIGRT